MPPSRILYHYVSPVGLVWIEARDEGFVLCIEPEGGWASYESLEDAVSSVFLQVTGWDDLDSLEGVELPATLSEWQVGPPPDP